MVNVANFDKRNTRLLCISFVLVAVTFLVESRELHPEVQAFLLHEEGQEANFETPSVITDDYTTALPAENATDDQMLQDETPNDVDIKWFKTNIVQKYGFVKDPKVDMWTKQGNFGSHLGKPQFVEDAKRIIAFFKRNNDWETTKNSKEFRKTGTCLELLYITAARYLLVTHILWERSGKKLIPCGKDGPLTKIPVSVCYPEPYGTASCTSDYDVGLVGKDSGSLVSGFNQFFESPTSEFRKPSEYVFDTNVYAFTLEYAMPTMFSGLPNDFKQSLHTQEGTVNYKMQELASALFKVFKYNEEFFNVLYDTASTTLTKDQTSLLNKWKTKFQSLHLKNKLKDIPNLRAKHNVMYQGMVKMISDLGGYNSAMIDEELEDLAVALLYAAEAYHTRGAIRHVVGHTQMKLPQYDAKKLRMMDLWVSMIENWGETNKEYTHSCEKKTPVILEVCLLKICKYFWRVLAAMRVLRGFVPAGKRNDLVCFAGDKDPEITMLVWLKFFKQTGKNQVPSNKDIVRELFVRFECQDEAFNGLGKPLSRACMQSINRKVNLYNKKIAKLFSGSLTK